MGLQRNEIKPIFGESLLAKDGTPIYLTRALRGLGRSTDICKQ